MHLPAETCLGAIINQVPGEDLMVSASTARSWAEAASSDKRMQLQEDDR